MFVCRVDTSFLLQAACLPKWSCMAVHGKERNADACDSGELICPLAHANYMSRAGRQVGNFAPLTKQPPSVLIDSLREQSRPLDESRSEHLQQSRVCRPCQSAAQTSCVVALPSPLLCAFCGCHVPPPGLIQRPAGFGK